MKKAPIVRVCSMRYLYVTEGNMNFSLINRRWRGWDLSRPPRELGRGGGGENNTFIAELNFNYERVITIALHMSRRRTHRCRIIPEKESPECIRTAPDRYPSSGGFPTWPKSRCGFGDGAFVSIYQPPPPALAFT